MRVGDVDVLVETVSTAGSEPTSVLDKVGTRAAETFEQAQEAIVAIASSAARTVQQMEERGLHPDQVTVEFGLRFAAQGGAFVASASAEAALRVSVIYNAAKAQG